VLTPQLTFEVVAAVVSARLRLRGFYSGCKGTTLFRPLAPGVGSVLPSGAGVDGDTTVGDQLPKVTGKGSGGCGSRGPPEALLVLWTPAACRSGVRAPVWCRVASCTAPRHAAGGRC
jgi:hypothetical protein